MMSERVAGCSWREYHHRIPRREQSFLSVDLGQLREGQEQRRMKSQADQV